MVEVNKEQNEQTTNNKKEKEKEKLCCVCMITENEATEKGLKFIGMNTIYNKKFDEFLGIDLSESPKIRDSYVCNKCVEDTTMIVENLMKNKNIVEDVKEYKEKIDSFTDYILSSSYLFGLENVILTQASFNMFEAGIENLIETNPKFAKHAIKTSLIELERKLQELEKI